MNISRKVAQLAERLRGFYLQTGSKVDEQESNMKKVGSSNLPLATNSNPANTDKRRYRLFNIRWNEKLGKPECPYMRRWVIDFGLFSIRLHQWYRSDDKRFMHNHAFNFLTIVLKGGYVDVSYDESLNEQKQSYDLMTAGSIRYRKANHTHYVGLPDHGTFTLLFCSRKKQNWGFLVNNKIMRPLRFFSRYGHPDCSEE